MSSGTFVISYVNDRCLRILGKLAEPESSQENPSVRSDGCMSFLQGSIVYIFY